MAQSPTHKFGQIIGELLESLMHKPLKKVAAQHGLYLDYQHSRPARENRKKVCWTDSKNNKHDLDYVLEHGGSEKVIGSPKAFIEIAWRRYTKHSRNKAQEMQGAIIPLAETYHKFHPFLGVVLAGEFTQGSLDQLRSHGFGILYFPYSSIMKAFAKVGIDALVNEDTADETVQQKVDAYLALSDKQRQAIATKLKSLHRSDVKVFLEQLETSLGRGLISIVVVPLSGTYLEALTVEEAVNLISAYDESRSQNQFVRYEIIATYCNGDSITGNFQQKSAAIQFVTQLV
jgi:hypothetical protein